MNNNQTTQIESINLSDLENVTGGGLFGVARKLWKPLSTAGAVYSGYSRNKAYHDARSQGSSRPGAIWKAIKHPF
jgi:hypothetical protein